MNAIYNSITNERLDIRNTGLSVLSDVLALAASDVAETDAQRDLLLELLYGMDQYIVGTGGSYIDVIQLPWGDNFAEQQSFLLAALDKIQDRHRWHELWYEPNSETTLANAAAFRTIISNLKESEIAPEDYERVTSYVLCPKHNVLEHVFGCVICHNRG